jgi:ABC-type nitrate/sulfonate/bicarbonate transport system substrate-binding protein
MNVLKICRVLAVAAIAFAAGSAVSTGAGRPVVTQATVAGVVAPWCLTNTFLYNPAFGPPGSVPDIDFQQTLLSPAQAVIAVDGAQVNMNDCVGLGSIAQAWAKGAHNIVMVAVNGSVPAYDLIGSKNMKSLADFKGKALASNGFGTTQTQALVSILLKGAGLQPDRDYNFVSAATGGARVAALTTGKVDGIAGYAPVSYKLIDQGYPQLGTERQYTPNYVQGALIVNRQWAQANRPLVVAMLRSMLITGRWLKDPSKKNEIISELAGVTMDGAKLGPDYARRIYADTISVDGGIGESGGADRALFQSSLQFMIDRELIPKGDYPLDQMVDFSYLNEARRDLHMPPLKGM